MEKPLSLLYTAGIAGDLALLPRLFTFIQQLKATMPQPALLLDLGGSCRAESWHCRVTGNRSTLIALDGMGYHAANVDGLLEREARDQLADIVTMGLVDARHDWRFQPPPDGMPIVRAALDAMDEADCLQIVLAPAAATRLEGRALFLRGVDKGEVGKARLDLRGGPRLVSARIHAMPPDTPPNPGIAGMVEFIEAEARLLARKRAQSRIC